MTDLFFWTLETGNVIAAFQALPWFFQYAILALGGIAALRVCWLLLNNFAHTMALAIFLFGLGFFMVEGGYI